MHLKDSKLHLIIRAFQIKKHILTKLKGFLANLSRNLRLLKMQAREECLYREPNRITSKRRGLFVQQWELREPFASPIYQSVKAVKSHSLSLLHTHLFTTNTFYLRYLLKPISSYKLQKLSSKDRIRTQIILTNKWSSLTPPFFSLRSLWFF